MSTRSDTGGSGLSIQTLIIASLSSLAAAILIHNFWQAGAIVGAAVTPVIVALVSEALRKPAAALTSRTGRTVAIGAGAFLIAAFLLTGAEAVFGGASDSDRFRVLPGKQERSDREQRDQGPAQTQEQEAPREEESPQEEAPPAETAPPEEEVPPAETTPETPTVPPPPPEQPPETLPSG